MSKYDIQTVYNHQFQPKRKLNVNFADMKVNMNLLQFLLGFMDDEGPFKPKFNENWPTHDGMENGVANAKDNLDVGIFWFNCLNLTKKPLSNALWTEGSNGKSIGYTNPVPNSTHSILWTNNQPVNCAQQTLERWCMQTMIVCNVRVPACLSGWLAVVVIFFTLFLSAWHLCA